MKLYHFTSLLHLPSILREGITKGEVPLDPRTPYNKLPQAPNLTSNGNPHQQSWIGGLTDKTKVRLTVEVPDEDLTTFRQVRDKYGIRASWLKRLDPSYDRRNWYFAFGGIQPSQIVAVEVLENRSYRQIAGDELDELVARIEQEKEKLDIGTISHGVLAGATSIQLKSGHSSSWLLDGKVAVAA
jgi:hypothetical protein